MLAWSRVVVVVGVCLGISASAFAGKAPSDQEPKKTLYTNYRLNFVKLQTLSGKDRESIRPSHPATISIAKMREMLAAVHLSRRAFFKKGKIVGDREVFDDDALALLAPHLVEGLRRASATEVVAFSYLFKNPKFVIRNDRFTSGTLWMEGTDLHVAFTKMLARLDGDLDKRGYDTKMVGNAKGVRLVLEIGPGMTYGRSKRELILNTKDTFVAAGDNKFQEQTTSGRLEELQRLRAMGLISPEEFAAKRRTILNQL